MKRFVMTQLMLIFKFEGANVNFQQFWTFLPIFKILCCLTVLVVCVRALNNWKRFDTNLVNKLFVTTFYLVFGHEKQFLTVFSVFH